MWVINQQPISHPLTQMVERRQTLAIWNHSDSYKPHVHLDMVEPYSIVLPSACQPYLRLNGERPTALDCRRWSDSRYGEVNWLEKSKKTLCWMEDSRLYCGSNVSCPIAVRCAYLDRVSCAMQGRLHASFYPPTASHCIHGSKGSGPVPLIVNAKDEKRLNCSSVVAYHSTK